MLTVRWHNVTERLFAWCGRSRNLSRQPFNDFRVQQYRMFKLKGPNGLAIFSDLEDSKLVISWVTRNYIYIYKYNDVTVPRWCIGDALA